MGNNKINQQLLKENELLKNELAKLKASGLEKKYKDLYNSIRDSILVADTNRNIVDCNPAFSALFGYSFDEIFGKQTITIYENESEFNELGDALKAHFGDEPFLKTVNYKKKSGAIFPGETNVFYLKDENGKVTGFIGLIRDISERKQTETALHESEEKYHLLYDNTPMSYQSLNEDGTIKAVNPAWLRTLGYNENEVIGNYFGDFLHKDYKTHFEKNFPAFKKRGYIHDVHFKIKHKDGHFLDISFDGRIGYLPDGNFGQTYCVFEDITNFEIANHKAIQAEEALRESEEKFRSIFELSPIGKSMTGIDGSLRLNKAFCDILGYSENELKSKNWKEITYPEDIHESENIVQSLMNGKIDRANYEKRYIHKNGNIIWTDVTTAVLRGKDGNPQFFTTSILDISKRKKMEEELKHSNYLLEESQKVASLGSYTLDFATGNWESSTILNDIFGIDNVFKKDVSGWLQIIYEQDQDMMQDYLNKNVIEKREPFNKEYRIRRINDKEIRWVHGMGKLQFNGDGIPLKMIGTIQDITNRKQDEEELKKHHDHLEELVKERTIDLETKNKELDNTMKVFVGRELTIRKLQERIKALEGK